MWSGWKILGISLVCFGVSFAMLRDPGGARIAFFIALGGILCGLFSTALLWQEQAFAETNRFFGPVAAVIVTALNFIPINKALEVMDAGIRVLPI